MLRIRESMADVYDRVIMLPGAAVGPVGHSMHAMCSAVMVCTGRELVWAAEVC